MVVPEAIVAPSHTATFVHVGVPGGQATWPYGDLDEVLASPGLFGDDAHRACGCGVHRCTARHGQVCARVPPRPEGPCGGEVLPKGRDRGQSRAS